MVHAAVALTVAAHAAVAAVAPTVAVHAVAAVAAPIAVAHRAAAVPAAVAAMADRQVVADVVVKPIFSHTRVNIVELNQTI